MGKGAEADGWISWAWNSVLGEEEDEIESGESTKKNELLLAIGIHIKNLKFLLKSGHRPYTPVICVALAGTGVELLVKGEDFFSSVFGITSIKLFHWIDSNSNLGAKTLSVSDPTKFATIGTELEEKSGIGYNYESLWDFRCAENNGVMGEYPAEVDEHFQLWTDTYANNKYGAFFLDYVFKMKELSHIKTSSSFSGMVNNSNNNT